MKRNSVYLLMISAVVIAVWKGQNLAADSSRKNAALAINAAPINLPAEILRAKTEKKLLLLEFGSSDSCPPCTAIQKNVFSTAEFMAYEKSNLVFLRVDFPFQTDLPKPVNETNSALAKTFNIEAYPTFLALDDNGKEFWRLPEKDDMTFYPDRIQPKEFIKLIEAVKQKKK